MELTEHLESGGDSLVSALETHTVRQWLELDNGRFSAIDHEWKTGTQDVWRSNGYSFNMGVTGRSGMARATYLDGACALSEDVSRVMVVPPGRTVRSAAKAGRQRTVVCVLKPEVIDECLSHRPEWDRRALAQGLNLDSPTVEWFLLKIYDELTQPGFAQSMMIESLAQALAVAMIRSLNLHDDAASRASGGISPARMRLLRERIHSDQPKPQLSELAELCGMSVRHLSRAFRAETNMTVAKYVEKAMAERARDLIANSDLSIGEVAARIGFADCSSFAHAFRRATGMLPSALRR